MAKTLVIVESPAKARTLERFLGDKYQVKACYGHVRDLPESASQVPDEIRKKNWGRLGVDTDGDFKPYYVIPDDKRQRVNELKTALKGASGGTLTRLGDARIASGKDFDSNGVLTGKNARLLSDADAAALVDVLNGHLPWTVTNVEAKPGIERPAAPFTTSTLTQEASRKL